MNLNQYYRDENILQKHIEYIGSADYIVGYGKSLKDNFTKPFSSFEADFGSLEFILNNNLDLFRSVMDRDYSFIFFDIEKYSINNPTKFCLDQVHTYHSLENLNNLVLDLFSSYGIDPLTLASGQGYHYVIGVDKNSLTNHALMDLGSSSLRSDMKFHCSAGRNEKRHTIHEELAFLGLGKLMEFFSLKIMNLSSEYGIHEPINFGDVYVPHEGISLDISMFEAPIHMRDIRCPFSTHQKMRVKYNSNDAPVMLAIPRNIPEKCDLLGSGFELDLDDLFRLRTNYADAVNYSKNINLEIPINNDGVRNIILDYLSSPVKEWHDYFDSFFSQTPDLNFHEFNGDFLNPTTMSNLVDTYYDGDPRTAKQLARYLNELYQNGYGSNFNFDQVPPESKSEFWMRILCSKKQFS